MNRDPRLVAVALLLAMTALCGVLPAAAAPAPAVPEPPPAPAAVPITLTADHIEYESTTGVVVAEGHVQASQGDTTITADHLRGNLKTEDVEASGHVVFVRAKDRATGDHLRYNYRTRVGHIEEVATQVGPYHVASGSMDTTGTQGVAYNTDVTPCDPEHPAFAVSARRAVIVPDQYIILYTARILVAGVTVLTIPQYTIPLHGRRVGISGGYNNLDGPWIEYRDALILSDTLTDYYRIRYGQLAGFSGENVLVLQGPDHAWDLDVGRTEVYDANGKLFYLDQAAIDINYVPERIPGLPGLPVTYTLQGHFGNYNEAQSGVSTSRAEGRVDLASDPFQLTPELSLSAGAWSQVDVYGTAQQRSVSGVTAAAVQPISQAETLSLTYYYQSVFGPSPFLFDAQSPAATLSFTYSYYGLHPGALLQSGSVTFTYDFLALQTNATTALALAVSPQFTVGMVGTYNMSLRQWTEIDYSVAGHCDCVQVNLVLKTFPQQGPQANQLFLLISLTTVPDAAASVRLY